MDVFNVSTKPDKSAAEKSTVLSIDWTGATEAQIKAFATKQIVVALQAKWRKNGIPGKETVKVADLATGRHKVAVTPETVLAAAAGWTPEQRAALLKQLTGK